MQYMSFCWASLYGLKNSTGSFTTCVGATLVTAGAVDGIVDVSSQLGTDREHYQRLQIRYGRFRGVPDRHVVGLWPEEVQGNM
jgi:hypothetical protein